MLRNIVFAVGALALAGGLLALLIGHAHPGAVFIVWGVVLAGGILCERFRYKPLENKSPGPDWERTGERFFDEETGKTVTVYMRPQTGERAYVEE
jgi:hypothetical protein